jgi:hypothetical protein
MPVEKNIANFKVKTNLLCWFLWSSSCFLANLFLFKLQGLTLSSSTLFGSWYQGHDQSDQLGEFSSNGRMFRYYIWICSSSKFTKVAPIRLTRLDEFSSNRRLFTMGSFSKFTKVAPSRVTRLDEFSSNGRLFTMGSFSKFTKVAPIFGPLLSPVKAVYQF